MFLLNGKMMTDRFATTPYLYNRKASLYGSPFCVYGQGTGKRKLCGHLVTELILFKVLPYFATTDLISLTVRPL